MRFVGYIVCFLLCVHGDRYHGDSNIDLREILHDGRYGSQTGLFPFLGQYPQGSPKSKILALEKANIAKMVSRSVTCQLELKITSTRAF